MLYTFKYNYYMQKDKFKTSGKEESGQGWEVMTVIELAYLWFSKL